MKQISEFTLTILLSLVATLSFATDYFVDSRFGNDGSDGQTPETAWRTLERVNQAELVPGDAVRFRRDGVWRGILRCRSGEPGNPIVYSDYQTGDEQFPPRILNSVDLTDAKKWVRVGAPEENLWATIEDESTELGARSKDVEGFAQGSWHVYTEEDAKASFAPKTFEELDGAGGYSLECLEPGTESSFLQMTTEGFPIRRGKIVALKFKARASEPFELTSGVSVFMTRKPWTSYANPVEIPRGISSDWQEYRVSFQTTTDAEDGRLTFFLGGKMKKGTKLEFVPLEATELEIRSLGLSRDVGNLVLTDGSVSSPRTFENEPEKLFASTSDKRERAAFKRWALEDLKEPEDFWYDNASRRVYLKSDRNPGEKYASIEAPLRDHCCRCEAKDVIIENITFSHTGAHGISLVGSDRVVIRNCAFDWIGGGDLSGEGGSGKRVRFGNGVEFWDGSEDCVVERCRFSRVYDVAITTQGSQKDVSRNLVMRDNLMYRCEQAFEIWFDNPETVVEGLVFERNLCVACGRDWSHVQRPNKIATPILGYQLSAKTVDITIRKNVFYDTAQFFVKCWHNRMDGYKIDNNVYAIDERKPRESGENYFCFNASAKKEPMNFEQFRAETGSDKNSRWIAPAFKDYENDDFTLLNRDELNAGPDVESWAPLW
ncbi:MAG: right-handed parallel beta-helix repeat-containing protein [Thermoguttaceae bacterium]|nr:right-handed parallel beta-helix repeat-containing protein [Thermoguttaceae bacterium]